MPLSPLAGKPAPVDLLIDVQKLVTAYDARKPDLDDPQQLVSFGTSGHRGTADDGTFTEAHILAITQAICDYRTTEGITGPLFMGMDTHALSAPAQRTALEVLAGNGVDTMLQPDNGFTPTPVVSHAIIAYNRGRQAGLADGIIITPSHNPPRDGGFKYNATNGGPAETDVTKRIEDRANALLKAGNLAVKRMSYEAALKASTTHAYDFLTPYTPLGLRALRMFTNSMPRVYRGTPTWLSLLKRRSRSSIKHWRRSATKTWLRLTIIV